VAKHFWSDLLVTIEERRVVAEEVVKGGGT
jgi:hypothetical protein